LRVLSRVRLENFSSSALFLFSLRALCFAVFNRFRAQVPRSPVLLQSPASSSSVHTGPHHIDHPAPP
jgi:hypothetical protein